MAGKWEAPRWRVRSDTSLVFATGRTEGQLFPATRGWTWTWNKLDHSKADHGTAKDFGAAARALAKSYVDAVDPSSVYARRDHENWMVGAAIWEHGGSTDGLGKYGKSYTYGQLPPFDEFEAAYDALIPGEGHRDYLLVLELDRDVAGARGTLADRKEHFTAKELYRLVKELVAKWEDQNDAAGDVAFKILQSLGIEWV